MRSASRMRCSSTAGSVGAAASSSIWWSSSGPVTLAPALFRRFEFYMVRPATHIERLKRALLADFQLALAHEFQRGGKGAGDGGDTLARAGHIAQQIVFQGRPVGDLADHTVENRPGVDQRPDAATLDRY